MPKRLQARGRPPGRETRPEARTGFSLLEFLLVLCLIGLLCLLALPAVQRVRAAADRLTCASNLRQIGLAIILYHDSQGVLPYARLCPAPWRDGEDPYCETLPSPATWTGPNEIWWAPYDNRPGTTPTRALPGYVPESVLGPFIENNSRVFHCPEGIDFTQGSPTLGESFQVSYAMSPTIGGKRLTDRGLGGFGWDHMDLPACASAAGHWVPWPADPATVAARHSPGRHQGLLNTLGHQADVHAVRPHP
jgi:type II secretory pathway pseudopilin PulG